MRALLLPSLLLACTGFAQPAINGPMLGHVDMLAATVWMQCLGPCAARMEYWKASSPDSVMRTPVQDSDASQAHCLDFNLDGLVPGTEYRYRPIVNGKAALAEPLTFRTQTLWKHRTDPPAFTVALGSCTYVNEPAYDRPGTPYGGGYGIFDAIATKQPDAMLWLGDNIYLREPDWGTRSGYLHRYTHTRSLPEMQRLLRTGAHYAIWDDHDYGPNDADGSWIHGDMALTCFDLFWPNPTCGAPGVKGAITSFSHADVDFFLLDNRSHRVPGNVSTSAPGMLGDAQIDWLMRALKYSDAAFKVVAVGSQVLNSAAIYETYATMGAERERLLKRIEDEGLRNVVFLTGDRHFTELSSVKLKDGRTLYDLTCSPLTSGVHKPKEVNANRVDGTLVEQRNFATLSFSGVRKERMMTMRVFDAEGRLLWERAIQEERKPK
ncbi:MAG: alkaline phosphatase D family protein [Flavobacteriales bacterium]